MTIERGAGPESSDSELVREPCMIETSTVPILKEDCGFLSIIMDFQVRLGMSANTVMEPVRGLN
ncbi:hypothetical protein M514_05944 [Trichuris suis]|uniref:Uncharacterized protein n=1 Tax=Trichuris suis TaxID=68888 RepID=A0A085N7V8_9BILA|nr:hypothetical protein M513_05944 [Trichuris suis]KFD65554.1 hypothetical protein M514_05944 [Trichuris suis]